MITWPSQLIDSLARRKAVLVIGSGISKNSVSADGTKHPPTWHEFLTIALNRIGSKGTKHIKLAISNGDYLRACEWLKARLNDDWIPLLRSEFVTPGYQPNDFHRALYSLDQRVVLTPNFDQIYDVYATAESDGTLFVKTYERHDISELIRNGIPLVLKYHGSIDTPRSMIFTHKSYAEARVKHASSYRLIDALFLTNTTLFVGCGTSDPDLQLLLEQYAFEQVDMAPHYILLPEPVHDDIKDTLRQCYGLTALTYRVRKGDHAELLTALQELSALVAEARNKLAAAQSW